MSCGKPHETPCTEVISLTYVYIDGEIDEVHHLEVTRHLAECPPCSDLYAAEVLIKSMVKRSCSGLRSPMIVGLELWPNYIKSVSLIVTNGTIRCAIMKE